MGQPGDIQGVLQHLPHERIGRRGLLKRAGLLGFSAASLPALLAACGGNGSSTETTSSSAATIMSTSSTGGNATASTGTSVTPAASGQASGTSTSSEAGNPRSGGTLKFGKQGTNMNVDPQIDYNNNSASIQLNIYDGLVTTDLKGFLAPALATSWDITPDGLNYVLHLRQGVTFHDGSTFSAADVVYSFQRILDPANKASLRPNLQRLKSFDAPDEATVNVVLTQPYATLLSLLGSRSANILSKDFTGDYTKEMNGTGPFKLDSFEAGVLYTFVKFPNYWQAGKPYLDKVEIHVITDHEARYAALKSGQLNFAEYIQFQHIQELQSDKKFTVYVGNDIYNYVRININRDPLKDPKVRQALNYAVDRSAHLNLAFGGFGLPATVALIPPDDPVWYNKELDPHWTYDPKKAVALLADAGYQDPSKLAFTLECSTESNHFDSAQILIEQWKAIGVSADLKGLDGTIRSQKRTTGDYTIMFDGAANVFTDPDFYSLIVESDGPVYATGVKYNNPDVDRLLKEGRETIDQAKRKEIYKQLEEVLLEDAPFIYLYWRPQAEASAANVKGYTRVPGVGYMSVQFFEDLWIDG